MSEERRRCEQYIQGLDLSNVTVLYGKIRRAEGCGRTSQTGMLTRDLDMCVYRLLNPFNLNEITHSYFTLNS